MSRETDERLIAALHQDGRASYSALSKQLGIPRSGVSSRIRALVSEGTIRIVAAVDPKLLGETHIANVTLVTTVPQRGSLLNSLVEHPDIPLVSTITGEHDLVVEARARTHNSLDKLISWILSFEEVKASVVNLYTNIWAGVLVSRYDGESEFDAVDAELVEHLRRDGRRSFRKLAKDVHLSETAVRNRIGSMVQHNMLSFRTLIPHTPSSGRLKVGFGLNVRGTDRETLDTVAAYPEIEFLTTCMGTYNALGTINSGNISELLTRISEIKRLPSITRVSTWLHLETLKEDYSRPMKTKAQIHAEE